MNDSFASFFSVWLNRADSSTLQNYTHLLIYELFLNALRYTPLHPDFQWSNLFEKAWHSFLPHVQNLSESSYLNVMLNKKLSNKDYISIWTSFFFPVQRWRLVLSHMAWSEPMFLLPCRKLFNSHLIGFVCSTQVPRRLHYPACFEGRRISNSSRVFVCVLEMFLHLSKALDQFLSSD